jgi:hypothetical protein
LCESCGHFTANESPANDDSLTGPLQGTADGVRVLKIPQIINTVEISPWDRQPARSPSGGQEQLLETYLAPIGKGDVSGAKVEGRSCLA